MIIVQVHALVKPDMIEAFRIASLENAQCSIQENGIARFDILQQQEAPERFVLLEVYRNQEAVAKHKETLHYQKWRDRVADMMAEPRYSVKYLNIYPEDSDW